MMGKTMVKRYLLWDFDGTLADAPGLWLRALRSILARAGIARFDNEILRKELRHGFPWHSPEIPHAGLFRGRSYWEFLSQEMASAMGKAGLDETVAAKLSLEIEEQVISRSGYELIPGATEVLRSLRHRGYIHVIASNHIPELEQIVAGLGIQSHFERIYTSGKIGYEKPNPRFFEIILQDIDLRHIFAMVGDSFERDVEGAARAGIRPIWFNREGESLSGSERVQSIGSLEELSDVLDMI